MYGFQHIKTFDFVRNLNYFLTLELKLKCVLESIST